jgi:serine/threonine protein kinase
VSADLKPDNLMLDEYGRVKIVDFGFARLKPRQPTPGPTRGSYLWMVRIMIVIMIQIFISSPMGGLQFFFSFVKAPEVMLQKPYNHAADVYSWAIILWQLITGACSASPYRKEEVPVERGDQRLRDPLLFMARLQCVRRLFEIQVLDLLPWGRNIVFIACRSSGTL